MVRVRFTTVFAERIGGISAVEVPATTVASALRSVTDRYPELARLVWLDQGVINPVMAVFVNDRQLQPGELETHLQAGDEIDIIPAAAGG